LLVCNRFISNSRAKGIVQTTLSGWGRQYIKHPMLDPALAHLCLALLL